MRLRYMAAWHSGYLGDQAAQELCVVDYDRGPELLFIGRGDKERGRGPNSHRR
jgi:hypothetical protein